MTTDLSERVARLKRQGGYWKNKYSEFPQQYSTSVEQMPGDCHYKHIVVNLFSGVLNAGTSIAEAIALEEPPERSLDLTARVEQAETDLGTYFQLLEDFPAYREAEFTTYNGFFPSLWREKPEDWHGGDWYVAESNRRLRGVE